MQMVLFPKSFAISIFFYVFYITKSSITKLIQIFQKDYATNKTVIHSKDDVRSRDFSTLNKNGPENSTGSNYQSVVIDQFS